LFDLGSLIKNQISVSNSATGRDLVTSASLRFEQILTGSACSQIYNGSMPNEVPAAPSAYYWAAVEEFVSADPAYITGRMVTSQGHNVELEQLRAWEEEIAILAPALRDIAVPSI
jgi:hypothetical protein